ncbi:MAG: LysR family transcriptional regulator [Pseudomonadota bacterium]
MLRLLRFRDLEYFVAVAEHRSFAKAAGCLGTTQPTLSNQIRRIEELFSQRLFERSGRTIALSPEGRRILAHARAVLHAFYDMDRAGKGYESLKDRRFRIGILATVAPYLAAPFLEEIAQSHDKLRIELTEALTDALETKVVNGDLDAAIMATLPAVPVLTNKAIGVERAVFVSRDPVGRDPFKPNARRPILLMQEGHCFRELVHASIERMGSAESDTVDYRIGPASLFTLTNLVSAGIGDTVLPSPFVFRYASALGGLHTTELDPDLFSREVQFVYRKARDGNNDIETLRKLAARAHKSASRHTPLHA